MHAPRPRGSRIALVIILAGLWGGSIAGACHVRTRTELALDVVATMASGTATMLAGVVLGARWAARARQSGNEELLVRTVARAVTRRGGGPPTGPMKKLRAL